MISRREFLSKLAVGVGGTAALLAFRDDALARVNKAVEDIKSIPAEDVARDEIFWGRIQSAFTLDRTVINFNNGGVSPSPRTVHEVLKRYLDYSNQNPAFNMWQHLEPHVETVREKLARREVPGVMIT